MTTEEVLKLEGRELDAAVAEKILGWRWIVRDRFLLVPPDQHADLLPDHVFEDRRGDLTHTKLLRYSEDISAAWQVIDKLYANGFGFFLWRFEDCDEWAAVVTQGDLVSGEIAEAEAGTAARAICLVALLAARAAGGREG